MKSNVLPASVIIGKNCLSNDATGMKGLRRHNDAVSANLANRGNYSLLRIRLSMTTRVCVTLRQSMGEGAGFLETLVPSDLESKGPGGHVHPEPKPFPLEHVPGRGAIEFCAQGAPCLPPSSTLATCPGSSQNTPSGMPPYTPKCPKSSCFLRWGWICRLEYPPSYMGSRAQGRARDGKSREGWPGASSPQPPPPSLPPLWHRSQGV